MGGREREKKKGGENKNKMKGGGWCPATAALSVPYEAGNRLPVPQEPGVGFFGEAPEGCASLREPSLRGFRGKRASGGGQKNEIPKAQRGPRYRGAAGGGGSAQSRSGPAKPRRIWGGESRGGRPPLRLGEPKLGAFPRPRRVPVAGPGCPRSPARGGRCFSGSPDPPGTPWAWSGAGSPLS